MRSGPLGAVFFGDAEQLANIVWESSLTTHASITAAALAFAVATCVRLLVILG